MVYDAERVKEAIDSDGDGLPDAAVLNKMIAWAGGQVYAYISHPFPSYKPATQTPTSTTAHINEQCAVLACYRALGKNGRLIQRRYDQALEDLIEIREGRNNLDGVAVENVADSVRKDELRVFREKDRAMADYGEPAPGQVDGEINNDFFRPPA
jgi:hypothetical protein